MPSNIGLSQLFESLGNGTAGFQELLANEVRKFNCSLWNAFPDFVTQNSNVVSSFSRGYMTGMCADQGNPNVDVTKLFSGGQCLVGYRITGNAIYQSTQGSRNCGDIITWFTESSFLGPIRYIKVLDVEANAPVQLEIGYYQPDGSITYSTNVQIFTDSQPLYFYPECLGNTSGFWRVNQVTPTGVIRVDGQPDTCGNPPGGYPPSTPELPDLRRPVEIPLPDGTKWRGDINVVIRDNNISGSLEFPITFDIGGVTVNVNLGGFDFNFGDDPDPLPDGQPHPLPKLPSPPPPKTIPPGLNPDGYNVDTKDPEDPKEDTGVENLAFVRIVLTEIPINARTQQGSEGVDVIYAGWFQFTSGSSNFNRVPIHWQDNYFRAIEGSDGYRYTLYNGFEGFAQVLTSR